MGAWGTSLYANDTACDIRGDYVHKLKSGKSNLEATRELLEANQDILEDPDEGPLFWFALADTQWNYGKLLPDVKENALHCLSAGAEDERWKESSPKQYNAWKNTLEKLESKLNSPQPKEKKVRPYRLYRCKWNLGDVFVYQLRGEYSRSLSFEGKYIAFRKVSEDYAFPGDIYPLVQFYLRIEDTIPTLEELRNTPVIPALTVPKAFLNSPGKFFTPNVMLESESEKKIPDDNLFLLGNYQDSEISPFPGYSCGEFYVAVGWEGSKLNRHIERYVIDMYLAWRDQKDFLLKYYSKE